VTPDRWRQVTEIFHAALARDVGARDAFLRHACRGDPSLRKEVDALVAAHGEAGSFGSDPLFPEGAPRLSPGTRVGTYVIEDLLGVGGMGEVYRARDTELGRQVAIKILPGEWLADPDRRARLDKEARVLAALNHPHVASIYGVAQADGVRGLVLELVEGPTLAERMTEGPLPLTEALSVALQIADALDATHEKGIVHRDLKPANIKITPDGVVKVLDFGVAKVRQSEFPFHAHHEPPTGTAGQTGDEIMIGTAAYMSPEQARGKPVDKRADIWAFGCVLYEMLSGRRPFVGETTTDVLAAIVDRAPEWTALPATVPSSVRHLLERCLEKDPKRRLRDIGDARVELEDSLKPNTTVSGVQTGESTSRVPRFVPWAAVGVALLVVAVAFLTLPYIGSRFGDTPQSGAGESAKSAAEPTVVPLTSYPGTEDMPSLSPDGTQVAFRWNGEAEDNFDIYFKLVGPGNPYRLTTDPAPDLLPTYSPDGNWIAFLREQTEPRGDQPPNTALFMSGVQHGLDVYVIPALGRTGEKKVGVAAVPSLAWSADSRSLVISRSPAAKEPPGLAMLSIETGQVTQLTSPGAPQFDGLAAMAPDGKTLAFQRYLGPPSVWTLMLLTLPRPPQPAGELKQIRPEFSFGGRNFAWSADGGEIIYSKGPGRKFLWRIAHSGDSPPQRLSFAGEGAGDPATAARRSDRLVFSRSQDDAMNIWSLELDEAGHAKGQAVPAFESTRGELCPAFSPDGTKVAFQSNRSGSNQVWVCRSNGSDCSEVTQFVGQHAGSPAWSPNGKWLTFDGSEPGGSAIYVVRPDGGELKKVADGVVPRWSLDGEWIYYSRSRPQQLYRVARTGGDPEAVSGTAEGWVPEESPDSQWIYYSGHPVVTATNLRRAPSRGGEATDVFSEQVAGRNFVVTGTGIWYLTPSPSPKEGSLLRFYDFASKATRTVYPTERPVGPGLTLAPDGRRILFTQQDRSGSDLMVVENYR
jgi:eukaryotic-like serine/threonine-protein kinase